jgi:hypothetical protein
MIKHQIVECGSAVSSEFSRLASCKVARRGIADGLFLWRRPTLLKEAHWLTKGSPLFLSAGNFLCATPCKIISTTRLNAVRLLSGVGFTEGSVAITVHRFIFAGEVVAVYWIAYNFFHRGDCRRSALAVGRL